MTENKRYNYQDFEEYCTITDTNIYPKDLNDFYNELVQDGYLEDYDGDKEVVLELAEEKYQEYLEDHCMSSKEIIDLLNEQDERIRELEDVIKTYDTGCKEIYADKCKLEEENQRLKTMNKELIEIIHGISRESAETISKLWTGDVE